MGVTYIYDKTDYVRAQQQWRIDPEWVYVNLQHRHHGRHYAPLKEEYVIKWHLTKIILPNNSEILFSYDTNSLRYISSINETFFKSTKDFIGADNDYKKVNRSITYLNEHHNTLSSISWGKGHIDFIKSTTKREDMSDVIYPNINLNGYALDSVIIYGNNNTSPIKKYKLYHSYFGKVNTYFGHAQWLKLRLDSIQQLSYDNKRLPPYRFEYNKNTYNTIPSKFDFDRDIYGYYKDLSITDSFPKYLSKPRYYIYPDDASNLLYQSIYSLWPRSSYEGIEYLTTSGFNMNPNVEDVKITTMKKLVLPTGGYERFFYEGNTFRYDGSDRPGPGVRVCKIEKHFEVGNQPENVVHIIYDYSDNDTTTGLMANLPMLFKFDESAFKNAPADGYNSLQERDEWATILSHQVINMTDTRVGYTKVTKKIDDPLNPNNSITTCYYFDFHGSLFKNQDDYSAQTNSYLYKKPKSIMWILNDFAGNFWPLSQTFTFYQSNIIRDRQPELFMPEYNWNRGSLIKEVSFKNNKKVQSIEYTYKSNISVETVYGVKVQNYFAFTVKEGTPMIQDDKGVWWYVPIDMNYVKFRFGLQYYISGFKTLVNKKITDYFSDDLEDRIITNIEYHHDLKNFNEQKYIFNQESITNKSNGSKLYTYYIYPLLVNSNAEVFMTQHALSTMLSKHMLGVLLKTDMYVDDTKIDGKVTSYSLQNNDELVVPVSIRNLEGNNYTVDVSFDKYDSHGNLLEYHNVNNAHTTYLWGYNYEYPIAKIENARFEEDVKPLLGCTYDELQQKTTDEELFTIFNNLRLNLKDALVYTYTYKPLIGLSSSTTPNGVRTTYHYDEFNRLKTIRDQNGNVIKHYDYNFFTTNNEK